MDTEAQQGTPLNLPDPLTEAECEAFRRQCLLPDYWETRKSGTNVSHNITYVLHSYVSGSNHALIKKLAATSFPNKIISAIVAHSIHRSDLHKRLHNGLLLAERLYLDGGIKLDENFVSLVIASHHCDPVTEDALSITTVEELETHATVMRFIHRAGISSGLIQLVTGSGPSPNDHYLTIPDPTLERFVIEHPEDIDRIVTFFEEGHRPETTLEPLKEFLRSSTPAAVSSGWL